MTSLVRERCRDGGGKGRPLIRLIHWAAVCPYKGVWLHGRVPVGSVHALSSGLRGGEGSVSTMHTDRWESSQREAVLYLSICLLEGLGLLAPLPCVRAEEVDVLTGISDLNPQKKIKERTCNWNAVWWEGDREYQCCWQRGKEGSFQASQGKRSTHVDISTSFVRKAL